MVGVKKKKKKNFNKTGATKSSFRVVPVARDVILGLVERLGLNSFHTLEQRTDITSKPWYGSYKGIKEGETVMSRDALRAFVKDFRNEIATRKTTAFESSLPLHPRQFAAQIGIPMTEISEKLSISKNQVWSFYNKGNPESSRQITQFLQQQHTICLEEAEQMLKYCEALLSEDVYYDPIKTIEYVPSTGLAFGLTVPGLQNYLAGFGGCGINHNTYPLPEAQADRFLLKIRATYPGPEDELKIVDLYAEEIKKQQIRKVLNAESLIFLQKLTRQVPIATDIKKYAVNIVTGTRNKKDLIEYGASPRASIGMVLAAKANAIIEGRKYVSKEDINKMALPILRHRIILSFEAERQNLHEDDVIKKLLK